MNDSASFFSRRIRPLNTRTRQRFSQARMDVFASACDSVCRELKLALSSLLRTTVALEPKGFTQQSFRLFVSSEHLTRFARCGEMTVGLGLEPAVLFPMLDRLLGAVNPGDTRMPGSLKLTRLEEKLTQRILETIWQTLSTYWLKDSGSFSAEPNACIGGTEMTLGLELKLALAGAAGALWLYVPTQTAAQWLEFHPELLENESETSPILREVPWEDGEPLFPSSSDSMQAIAATMVGVSVRLPEVKVDPQSLAQWKVGDVISLDTDASALFDVFVQGTRKFAAEPGQYDQRKVAKIL